MVRLIFFIILVSVFYYVLYFLIKDILLFRKRRDGRSEPEELVEDPYCKTYIPKRSAIKKRVGGKDHFFCNPDCLKRYLEEKK
ncbi:MAG: hypothetical protein HXY46_12890 [Syntrophaceae bacterium]|nr:hypothetical protein [Syntrophaceae bacterium]